jgi:hypothetical protein
VSAHLAARPNRLALRLPAFLCVWLPPLLPPCCSMYSLILIPITLWKLCGGSGDDAEVRC